MEERNESQDELNLPEESLNHSERARQRRAERIRILRERRSAFSHHCHIQRRRIHEQQVQQRHAEQQRMARSQLSQEQRQQVREHNAQQHRMARSEQTVSFKIALQPVTDSSVELFSCGRRSHVCQYCHALKWLAEVSLGSICCFLGKSCSLNQLFPTPFPQPLQDLLKFDLSCNETPCMSTTLIRNFRHHIREYNCALQMASSQIKFANPPQGISMIAIKGAIHHLMGPLVPAQDEEHQFAQLYIIDNHDSQVNLRMSHLGGADSKLNSEILCRLQMMLHQLNPFVQQFRQVIDMINDNDHLIEYQITINTDGSVDHRRYN